MRESDVSVSESVRIIKMCIRWVDSNSTEQLEMRQAMEWTMAALTSLMQV